MRIMSPINPIIDVTELAEHLGEPDWAVIDCRFDLFDTTAGEKSYLKAHIPGAVYVHLDHDMSASKDPSGAGGRHPLPSPDELRQLFSRLGIGPDVQVIAYDDSSGHYAARLWWMLRFMGHELVAVLDGGWPRWIAAGLPIAQDREHRSPRVFVGDPQWQYLVTRSDIPGTSLLIDARAPERFRGEVEPIDPVAGHIPGAVNRPYGTNWTDQGMWRPQEELLADFLALLDDTQPEEAVFYCGSGVSACVNLVAMVRAGLPIGRLYVGSWSEWSRLETVQN